MNEVKRYKLATECGVAGHMESLSGKWVKYEEYAALQQQLTATTNSLTNAQEALKSAGIEADTAQAGVMELVNKLADLERQEPVAWCDEHDLKLMVNKRMIGGMMTVRHHGDCPLFTHPAPGVDLNAVRAEGVDALASLAGQNYQYHSKNREQQKKWKNVVLLCVQFAAQLRSGNAGKDGVCD